MRGIVIAPRYILLDKGKGVEFPGITGINSYDLRRYLTYWDKLDYPNNNILYTESSPEVAYLEEVGVLKRTMITTPRNRQVYFNEIYPRAHLKVYQDNNLIEPGKWSLAQSTSKLNLIKDQSVSSRTLEIELFNCLPIPSEEVSLDQILEFKIKRNDELLEFRLIMDEMYLGIINSGDLERAREHSLTLIKKKIKDIDKLMDESMFSRIKSNFTTSISINELVFKSLASIGGAVAGTEAGNHVGLPTLGAVAGFAGSILSFDLGLGRKPFATGEDKAFAYLYHTTNELK